MHKGSRNIELLFNILKSWEPLCKRLFSQYVHDINTYLSKRRSHIPVMFLTKKAYIYKTLANIDKNSFTNNMLHIPTSCQLLYDFKMAKMFSFAIPTCMVHQEQVKHEIQALVSTKLPEPKSLQVSGMNQAFLYYGLPSSTKTSGNFHCIKLM